MVVYKRRPPALLVHIPSSIPYGDGRASPICQSFSPNDQLSPGASPSSLLQPSQRPLNTHRSGDPPRRQNRILLVLCLLIGIFSVFVHSLDQKKQNLKNVLQHTLYEITGTQEDATRTLEDAHAALQRIYQRTKSLNDTRKALLIVMSKEDKEPAANPLVQMELMRHMKERREAFQTRITYMQQHIQRKSKNDALNMFGPGPHYVQVAVEIYDERGAASVHSFYLELAPIDLMPHSVNFFLRSVKYRIWDNTQFHGTSSSTDHVIQASPVDSLSGIHKGHHLEALGLDKLYFAESPASTIEQESFRHQKYTVGFAQGLGPDFYINTRDNWDIHGPKPGEHSEPCFGRVVDDSGARVVDMATSQATTRILHVKHVNKLPT